MDKLVIVLFSHNDGSGWAEMPFEITEDFYPGDGTGFDAFVSDFAEANDLTIEALNDHYLTNREWDEILGDQYTGPTFREFDGE